MRRMTVLVMAVFLVALLVQPAMAAKPTATIELETCSDLGVEVVEFSARVDFEPPSKKATRLFVSAYDLAGNLLGVHSENGWAVPKGVDLTSWLNSTIDVGEENEVDVVASLYFMRGKNATVVGKLWVELEVPVSVSCAQP